MKKAVLTLFLLLSLQSCSQKTMITQNPNITADNLVEEIAKQVKHYPSEPQYVMHYFNGVCNFEIYINDFKVVKSFNNESFKTSKRINPFLLSKNKKTTPMLCKGKITSIFCIIDDILKKLIILKIFAEKCLIVRLLQRHL